MLLNHETSRVFLINHPNRSSNEQSNTGFKLQQCVACPSLFSHSHIAVYLI